ncbi:hypothetical protein PAPHI01_1420 [Pancytospora philotis]|nr:hypothetical protein PAPHI01_1420 [Pancytospora philotis]
MLLAAIAQRTATALSLFLSIRATAPDSAPESKSIALARDSIKESIFEMDLHNYAVLHTSYDELLRKCMDGLLSRPDSANSDIRFITECHADDEDINMKRMFITLYLFSREDPYEEVEKLTSADSAYGVLEALFDLFQHIHCYRRRPALFFEVSEAGWEKIEANRQAQELRIRELLRSKIWEAMLVPIGMYLKGVFNPDTVVDAFLHLYRKSTIAGIDFYAELIALLDGAFEGIDYESEEFQRTLLQFVWPLKDEIMGLWCVGNDHAVRCKHAIRVSAMRCKYAGSQDRV